MQMLSDGVTDTLVTLKNEKLTVKFFPDENETPYILSQGYLGLSRNFPKTAQVNASVTISAEEASVEFSS